MDTITGLDFFARTVSRQITSDAKALPPGEFMRSTIALTLSSVRAFLIALEILSEPMVSSSPSPLIISPLA